MEVHHHPHVPHGKKMFKEYLLEFIMIFLAVTMGFIAENIREVISDHSKEHEYISGLIENFSKDTTELKTIIKQNIKQIKGLDSLRRVNKDKLSEVSIQDSLFILTARYIFYSNKFKNDDITLAQLRGAGGYRYIRNTTVIDSVASYESRMKDIDTEFIYVDNFLGKTRELSSYLFDISRAQQFFRHSAKIKIMISHDKTRIDQFYNQAYFAEVSLDGYLGMLKEHLIFTKTMITLLKKEYTL